MVYICNLSILIRIYDMKTNLYKINVHIILKQYIFHHLICRYYKCKYYKLNKHGQVEYIK